VVTVEDRAFDAVNEKNELRAEDAGSGAS